MSTNSHDPYLRDIAYSVADMMVKQAFIAAAGQAIKNFGAGQVQNFKNFGAVAQQRGLNPASWVKGGWDLMKGVPHPATSAAAQGWVGSGNITRHLPIGPKSLTVLQAGLGAKSALADEDPTGMGRSKKERMGEWAGRTIAGIGATLPGHVGVLPSLIASQVAGTVGARVGSRIGRSLDKKPKQQNIPQMGQSGGQ